MVGKIRNQGTSSAPSTDIEFRLIGAFDSGCGFQMFEDTIPALAPGEETLVELDVCAAPSLGGVLSVDPNNTVEESNDTNNEASFVACGLLPFPECDDFSSLAPLPLPLFTEQNARFSHH